MILDELKRPELINPKQLYTIAAKAIEDQTAFVVRSGDKCVGAVGGMIVPNILNPNITTLAEMMWYVLPEYRNTRAGALLFYAFDERGSYADEITFSLLPSSAINVNTLEKRGYMLSEYGFRKQIGE